MKTMNFGKVKEKNRLCIRKKVTYKLEDYLSDRKKFMIN